MESFWVWDPNIFLILRSCLSPTSSCSLQSHPDADGNNSDPVLRSLAFFHTPAKHREAVSLEGQKAWLCWSPLPYCPLHPEKSPPSPCPEMQISESNIYSSCVSHDYLSSLFDWFCVDWQFHLVQSEPASGTTGQAVYSMLSGDLHRPTSSLPGPLPFQKC